MFKLEDATKEKTDGKLEYLADNLLFLNLKMSPDELASVNHIIVIQDGRVSL